MKKKKILLLIAVIGILVVNVAFGIFLKDKSEDKNESPQVSQQVPLEKFSYKGEKEKDALTILKEKAEVIESQPGFVVSINGRSADIKKKEFWSFYVNGLAAQVGAGDYQTQEGDLIEWKIETY